MVLTMGVALGGGFGSLGSDTAFAKSGPSSSSLVAAGQTSFDIPSQALTSAVEAFSEATGIQVLYDSRLASGRRSGAVKGMLTPQAALRALLAGTDLKVQYANANGIVLVSASAAEVPEALGSDGPPIMTGTVLDLGTLHLGEGIEIGGDDDYSSYSQFIVTEVESALHRDGHTRTGDYNVGLQLWLDPSGAIRRSFISHSTGDGQRDASIIRVVQNLTISRPPPANMPQPVRINVFSRPQ